MPRGAHALAGRRAVILEADRVDEGEEAKDEHERDAIARPRIRPLVDQLGGRGVGRRGVLAGVRALANGLRDSGKIRTLGHVTPHSKNDPGPVGGVARPVCRASGGPNRRSSADDRKVLLPLYMRGRKKPQNRTRARNFRYRLASKCYISASNCGLSLPYRSRNNGNRFVSSGSAWRTCRVVHPTR